MRKWKLLSIIVALCSIPMVSCVDLSTLVPSAETGTENTDENGTTGAEGDQNLEGRQTSLLIQDSMVEMPPSLTSKVSSDVNQGGTLLQRTRAADTIGSNLKDIYRPILDYVTFTDEMRSGVETIIVDILKSGALDIIPLDTLIDLPANPSDPSSPRKVRISKDVEGGLDWQVELWFDRDRELPQLILRFSANDQGAKGAAMMEITEVPGHLATYGLPELKVTRYIEMHFDGMDPQQKSIDIRINQDLTEIVNYATENWADLTSDQKNALDLGQPVKGRISVIKNEETGEYTVSGTSYHPYWKNLKELGDPEAEPFGADRDMYVFSAKSLETDQYSGSKVNLAFPKNDSTDVSDIWSTDSISAVYLPIFKEQILDEVNNEILQMTGVEKYYALTYVIGYDALGMGSFKTEKTSFTQEEFDATKSFFTKYPNPQMDFTKAPLTDLSTLNTWWASPDSDLYRKDLQDAIAIAVASTKIDQRPNSGALTLAELDDFMSRSDSSDASEVQQIRQMTDNISRVVNPAFFSGDFLGTYNEEKAEYNRYVPETDSWDATPTDLLAELQKLDLSTITPYVPKDIMDQEVRIK